jgi:hypothetical protein
LILNKDKAKTLQTKLNDEKTKIYELEAPDDCG